MNMNINKTNTRLCTPSFQGGNGKQYSLLFAWVNGLVRDAVGNPLSVPVKAFAKTKEDCVAKAKVFIEELTAGEPVTARLDHQAANATYAESWTVSVDPAPSNPAEVISALDALLVAAPAAAANVTSDV